MCLPSQPFMAWALCQHLAGSRLSYKSEKSKEGKAIQFTRVLAGTLKKNLGISFLSEAIN